MIFYSKKVFTAIADNKNVHTFALTIRTVRSSVGRARDS